VAYSINPAYGTELAYESFGKVSGLFDALKHHISIQGVLSGILTGRVFVSIDGGTALLASPEGFFLGGSPGNEAFLQEANKLFSEELLPNLAACGELDYVLFYPSDEAWEDANAILMKDLLPVRSGRMTFTHDMNHVETSLHEHIVPVDRLFLQQEHVEGLDDIRDEILEGWPSIEAYEEKGFGCAAILDTSEGPAVISWCLTDWVVGSECELGIETDEDHRGKGWGRKTALGALALAKQRGITRTGWQCWSDNLGSQRTALSVGFTLLTEFPVLFGWNKPLNNLLVNGNVYMLGNSRVGKDYARSAWSYAQALDQGWDWKGDAALYWNAACMFYLTGETDRAVHYYKKALKKGWITYSQPHYHEYVYREEDSSEIECSLASLLNKLA
jgi:RimJ/RimL family protein N-acetyltransferase